MIFWPRLRTPIPPHLPALVLAGVFALALTGAGIDVDTIGSRFHYLLPDGSQAAGIPPYLPSIDWPWNRAGAGGQPLELSMSLVSELLPAAFAIAILGAIESLLCAVVLDDMSGKRHSANSELLAQGLANVVTPFFGGITATAAIARSATNYKAGAVSPVAALIHSAVVLMGLLLFANALAYVPMPAMAALLMVVAWNMSEAHKTVKLIKRAPLGDILVLMTCLLLTVFFDMVIAITAGILLASVLFMKEIATLTKVIDVTDNPDFAHQALPENWRVFKVDGPMFFAAADRILGELVQNTQELDGLILHMRYSPYLDAGGLSSIDKLVTHCQAQGIRIRFTDWQFQALKTLAKGRSSERTSLLDMSFSSLDDAVNDVLTASKRHE
jgi:SulP family sulfate permease